MAFWRTKAAISLKRVKMEEEVTMAGLLERCHPWSPMASPSSRLGVCNLATPLISGTGKATDFKFGEYIYRANPNKSPLKS